MVFILWMQHTRMGSKLWSRESNSSSETGNVCLEAAEGMTAVWDQVIRKAQSSTVTLQPKMFMFGKEERILLRFLYFKYTSRLESANLSILGQRSLGSWKTAVTSQPCNLPLEREVQAKACKATTRTIRQGSLLICSSRLWIRKVSQLLLVVSLALRLRGGSSPPWCPLIQEKRKHGRTGHWHSKCISRKIPGLTVGVELQRQCCRP